MINNFKMDFKAVFKSKTIYFVIIFMSLMHLISVYMAKGMPIYESNVTNGFISNIVNNQQSVFAILVVGNLVNIQMKNGIYKIAARGVRNRINIIISKCILIFIISILFIFLMLLFPILFRIVFGLEYNLNNIYDYFPNILFSLLYTSTISILIISILYLSRSYILALVCHILIFPLMSNLYNLIDFKKYFSFSVSKLSLYSSPIIKEISRNPLKDVNNVLFALIIILSYLIISFILTEIIFVKRDIN